MTNSPKKAKQELEEKPQFDNVLKTMLTMPPKPHKDATKKAQKKKK